MPERQPQGQKIGMPFRGFLYTLDQLAYMLSIDEPTLRTKYLHYDGRSIGARPKDRMLTRNIAQEGDKPDWRVTEVEVIRFFKVMGFKVYDRGWTVQ